MKIILFFSLLFFSSCKAQDECINIAELFHKAKYEDVYKEAVSIGKKSISCLINEIDLDEKGFVGFLDPNSSNIPLYQTDNYKGIQAIYLIELILSRNDSFTSIGASKLIIKGKEVKKGIIVKVHNNEPLLKPLEYGDMKILKTIYLEWFRRFENMTIDEMKSGLKDGNSILDGSQYKWI